MRNGLLAGCLLAVAVVVQLTVLNGLRLPGGGVPDLVLVCVAALALRMGPLYGMVAGFAAGLCIDLAPPASQLIGQYALVFCLAGWAAGRASRVAARSAVSSVLLLSLVVAAGEALAAAVGLVLEPAQVTVAQVRQVLPSTIFYDLLLGPFVLTAVLLLSSLLDRLMADQPDAARAASSRGRSRRAARRHQPRLAHAAARPGDGWLGTSTRRQLGATPSARRVPRLHPAGGVPGSASGLAHPRTRPGAPVNLRLAGRRPGDGAVGNTIGIGLAGHARHVGRHPGLLAGAKREFRPHAGSPAGSAAAQPSLGPLRPSGRTSIRFSRHRRDGTLGRLLGSSVTARAGLLAGPAAGRMHPTGSRTASVPRLRFAAEKAPASRRPASAPRFRRRSDRIRVSALTFGVRSGGALDEHSVRSLRRRHTSAPRLRLAGRRAGMLGGSGRGPALARQPSRLGLLGRRGPGRITKTPRFGYRRRSLLSKLSRSRVGGRWLAASRAGSRSQSSLLSRRTGGTG